MPPFSVALRGPYLTQDSRKSRAEFLGCGEGRNRAGESGKGVGGNYGLTVKSRGRRQVTGDAVDLCTKSLASLEERHTLGGHGDGIARPWIAPDPGLAPPDRKSPEAAQFHLVAA